MQELKEIFESFNKSPLRFLKRNFNLIIILPTLLGGLWQVIELSRMSFSFIRFFSVGQIIPDGLLILMFLIIFLVSAIIPVYWWNKLNDETETESDKKLLPKKGNFIYSVLFFFLLLCSLALIIHVNNYLISKIESIFNLFLYIPANLVMTVLALFFINGAIYFCKEIEILSHYRKMLRLMPLLVFYVQGFMVFVFTLQFHEVFMLPIDLKNTENLICKAEKIDKEANFEILYTNDKYVFVRCHKFTKDRNGNRKQSEIRIFKFEDLLDDTACIGNERLEKERIADSIKFSQIGLPKKAK